MLHSKRTKCNRLQEVIQFLKYRYVKWHCVTQLGARCVDRETHTHTHTLTDPAAPRTWGRTSGTLRAPLTRLFRTWAGGRAAWTRRPPAPPSRASARTCTRGRRPAGPRRRPRPGGRICGSAAARSASELRAPCWSCATDFGRRGAFKETEGRCF